MIFLPEIAHAATPTAESVIAVTIMPIMTYIVYPLIDLLMAAAVVVFIWGAAQLILNKDDSEKRANAQRHILFGVIGLFIMIGVFGIVRLVGNTVLPNNEPLPFVGR